MQTYSASINESITFGTPSYFITLLEKTDSAYKFEVVCSLLQSEIFLKSLNKMIINVAIPPTLEAQSIDMDLQIVDSNRKKNAKDKIDRTLTSISVDLQHYVNKDIIADLNSGISPINIPKLYAIGDVLEKNNNGYNAYSTASPNVDFRGSDVQNLNLSLISDFLIDPSIVADTNKTDNPIIIKLKNFYLNDALKSLTKDAVYYTSVKKNKFINNVNIKSIIEIPYSYFLKNTILNLDFEIYKKNNTVPVYRAQRTLDIGLQNSLFNLKEHAPIANIVSNKLYIDHESSKSFTIKKKQFNYLSINKDDLDYKTIGNVIATKEFDGLQINQESISIFRCLVDNVPYFKNVIIGKTGVFDRTLLIINSYNEPGAKLTISNFPRDVKKLKILRRHRFSGGGADEYLEVLPYKITGLSVNYSFIDQTVKHNQIYEYKIIYMFSNGQELESVTHIYQHFNSPLKSSITTIINNVIVTQDSLSFNISSDLIKTRDELLQQQLNFAGTNKTANSMSENEFNQDKITSYFVVRINLKTGEQNEYKDIAQGEENFNNILFVDNNSTQSRAFASSIDPTADYIYEVRALIKNPKSLLSNNIARGRTYKQYLYNTYKWSQPTVGETGTISSNITINDILNSGESGTLAVYRHNSISPIFELDNILATRIDSNKIKINWIIKNNATFDHLLLIKEVNKQRRFIGAVVSEVIDTIDNSELGTIIYYIITILNDYSLGPIYRTNTVLIDPE